jgi:hypothetical protein
MVRDKVSLVHIRKTIGEILAEPLHVSDLPCSGSLHGIIRLPEAAKKADFSGINRTSHKSKHNRKNNNAYFHIPPSKPAAFIVLNAGLSS